MATNHDKDILIINGRRYSAKTGKPLEGHRPSIDGLAHHRPKNHIAATVHAAKPRQHPAQHRRQGVGAHHLHSRATTTPHSARSHSIHKSHTVPVTPKPSQVAAASSGLLASNSATADRMRRARQIEQSKKISKFGRSGETIDIALTPPALAQPPVPQDPPVLSEHHFENIKALNSAPPAQHHRSVTHAMHTESKSKKHRLKHLAKKQKVMSLAAASLSVLIVVGYTLYLNMPNMAFKVAASKAGIDASLPEFKPDGFRFAGPVNYSSGSVVINFRSTTGDDRKYEIAQRESDWDSESLLENYVSRQSERYSIVENRGLTIYVWGGSNASWVDSGIWYSIEGDSLLGTDQLLKIASSL